MKIHIVVTGGTFDKTYNEINGSLDFKKTHIKEMLSLGRCNLDVEIHELFMMDSLEMSDANREDIINKCKGIASDKIIITHGTDTMPESAAYIAKSIKNKTIVLTGAMIPFAFGSSDGLFNLGSALAFCQSLTHGVYICMNGNLFPWDNVRKNKAKGLFETID